MKVSQKILALLLSLAMLFSLAGCGLGSIVSDSPTSISDTSADSESQITDGNSETDNQTKIDDKGSESNNQEKTTSPSSKPSGVGLGTATPVKPASVGAYAGTAYVVINNNQPNFSATELTTAGYEKYSELDSLGRCGVALASCGRDTMPGANETRGSISSIKPSGWIQAKYNGISGGYLWNRCHLIGWQLSAENANRKNLITGTRYMNIEGMLPFENMVAD